ncbi:plexin-C1 isoform X2 [Oryzias latipes]|uniref:plexin-C1 isoform X2 n=1 Tax=Oryzias latipes TaxID=8090 RepID=UPI000CE28161|nr:plexin-C1 isoform X2 [Oryzias latipes]
MQTGSLWRKQLCFNMILLLSLLFPLWAEPAVSLEEDTTFTLEGKVRHLAVAPDGVYIATEEKLYQLSHNLTPLHCPTLRGLSGGEGQGDASLHCVSERELWKSNFTVNVLLPFVANKTLLICGVTEKKPRGYCEVLDLKNISKVLHSEDIQVGPLMQSDASISLLVELEKNPPQKETYILTAIQQDPNKPSTRSDAKTINLQNTLEAQDGGIFSLTEDQTFTPVIESKGTVEFVDGFQINQTIYILSNVDKNKVRLLWLKASKSKEETLESLEAATLNISGWDGSRLLASSVVPGGERVLWSGVFCVDRGQTNTQLVLFDISPPVINNPNKEPDFYFKKPPTNARTLKSLTAETVLYKQNSMTSVLAVRQKTWMVFFVGTADGQLIKLVVSQNYKVLCPEVLYKPCDECKVFPRMQLDPVDQKHIYVPFEKKILRVPVSQCSKYKTLQECWGAQDPFCVWCGSNNSCMFEVDCNSSNWLSIPEKPQKKMMTYKVVKETTGRIKLVVQIHATVGENMKSSFACRFSAPLDNIDSSSQFPQCTVVLPSHLFLAAEGLSSTLNVTFGKGWVTEQVHLKNCSRIHEHHSSSLCQHCIRAGCTWTNNRCSWAREGDQTDSVCQKTSSNPVSEEPVISSITPSNVSFHGRNGAVLSGRNLQDVIGVRIQTDTDCNQPESPVWNNNGVNLTFNIPSSEKKGQVNVCVLLPDGSCHGNARITYKSEPICRDISPRISWMSGKRKVFLNGSNLEFVEELSYIHPSHVLHDINIKNKTIEFHTPASATPQKVTVYMKVANKTLECPKKIIYYPDPKFTNFKDAGKGNDVQVIIQKKGDKLDIKKEELSVWGIHDEKEYQCIMEAKESSNKTDSFICEIKNIGNINFKQLKIKYGDTTVVLKQPGAQLWMLLALLLVPVITVVVLIVYRNKQRKLTAKMNRFMENLELDIRNDIRQGFVDLQTEKADLIENVGAIPFLDYKHFAAKIFFPEGEALMALCIKDIGPDGVKVELDNCCQLLFKLIEDKLFLTSMVQAMEEQKSFGIKDRCSMASLLTVALHSNLTYLTEVMEVLLKDLMHQKSNAQPKLLLRRTESTVEKLLTNWMSICLYGFLRESVGQHLFFLVSALMQQIAKGPVDCVTGKALYTLSEDWLLWEAQNFSSLKLKVLFAVGSSGEVSEPLDVDALTCDTVEQLKEKILTSFKAKFGFPYNCPLQDLCVEYEKEGTFIPLQEVDASSEVIGEVTMLNTLTHYKVNDGATIKVLSKKTHPPVSPQGSVKDDENFSGKYFHLINPDVDEDQRKNPERKKLKVKEVHLTKLLSTKVAVHSFVANLFRSIWGVSHGRPPPAIKYYFDFLDAQADSMKITDPDVLHIWKTNSLPLRFWVNILKNPQFVFDLEKTPHLDGCLSVIAQAFMDSFSLSETQLGKGAPTNKLLYARDIPTFKQEVKAYYKLIRDLPPGQDADFKNFLREESKKHENEFCEAAALKELYKYVQQYFKEIKEKLEQNGAPAELTEQLHHVKEAFDGLKSCSWN